MLNFFKNIKIYFIILIPLFLATKALSKEHTIEFTYEQISFTTLLILLLIVLIIYILKKYKNTSFQLKTKIKKLEERNNQLIKVQHIVKLGFWEFDVKNDKLYWSREIYEIFNLDPNKFKPSYLNFVNIVHPDDRRKVNEAYKQSLKNKKNYSIEHRLLTKDNTIKWIHEECVTKFDENGNPLISIGTVQDITQNKLVQIKLQQQKKEFENIFNSSKDGIAILDLDFSFIDFNQACLDITGFKREELLEKNLLELIIQKDKELIKSTLEIVLKGEYIRNLKKNCIVSNNKIITINMSISLMPDDKRILLTVKDITSIKFVEQQTKLAEMGHMIENIAHQWRQPLNIISTVATSVIIEKEFGKLEDESLVESLDLINEKAQYLSETIDIFRNYLKEKKEYKKVILQDRIKTALNIVKATLDINHINLVDNIDKVEPISINLVIGELSEVIINIINNAKDVLIEKDIAEPWIKVNLKKEDSIACITIEDNGGGVPKGILDKIFEPYFTTKKESQGTGLGLNMSYKIVKESLKGTLYIKNTKNGAKFFIELPLEN